MSLLEIAALLTIESDEKNIHSLHLPAACVKMTYIKCISDTFLYLKSRISAVSRHIQPGISKFAIMM